MPGDSPGAGISRVELAKGFHGLTFVFSIKTAISSVSFAAIILSISAMCLSVSFWISSCARRLVFRQRSCFQQFLERMIGVRRELRTRPIGIFPPRA